MRLSIDITPEQHQRLKAIAALQGQSMKDYVLNRVLPNTPETAEENEVLRQLEAFLEPRIKAAQGETVSKSVTQIFKDTSQEAG
jgi:uncharacterized protein (DUF1778 family)